MSEDGGPDAMSFAFAGIVRGQHEVWTMGMHVLGLRGIVMQRKDLPPDADAIIEVVRYACSSEKPIDDGHVLADESTPRFHVLATDHHDFDVSIPMHNPLGRLKLASGQGHCRKQLTQATSLAQLFA